ncbi:MAG: hypothetical protein GOU97_00515 [Nanoarchaeota archaeon]|nr:hypothetical protein [Nanoarchaeota archaeon]
MAKPRKQPRKRKKQEFEILAPPVFNEKTLGKTVAKDQKLLLGRTVNVTMREITGEYAKQYVHFKLMVSAVRGGKAHTELKKMEISKSYLTRMVRKGKTKLDKVFDHKTKDDKQIRIKIMMIVGGKIGGKQKKSLHHAIAKEIEKQVTQSSLEALTNAVLNQSLANNLKNFLRKIAPVNFVIIRMLEVKKPRRLARKTETKTEEPKKEEMKTEEKEPEEEKKVEKPKEKVVKKKTKKEEKPKPKKKKESQPQKKESKKTVKKIVKKSK